jgi:putative membrane protein
MKVKIANFLTILFLTAPAALFAWGGACFYDWYGGPHMGRFFGGGFFMLIVTIILLAFVAFIGLKYFKLKTTDQGQTESPLDIIKGRYAKGEISKEQFDALKKDLGNA